MEGTIKQIDLDMIDLLYIIRAMKTFNADNLTGKDGRVAVLSDPHFNHDREFIHGARGFPCKVSHKQRILSDLEQLKAVDLLACLGDFALNSEVSEVEELVKGIPCKTLFLFGNHPSGIKNLYEDAVAKLGLGETLGVKMDVFPFPIAQNKFVVGDQCFLRSNGRTYFLSHFAPYIWDKMQHGVVTLCGHSHGNCKELNPPERGFGKILDCGVDNALKYVGRTFFWLDEIDEIMKSKQIAIKDHH